MQAGAKKAAVDGMEVLLSLTPRDPGADPDAPPGDEITNIVIEEE